MSLRLCNHCDNLRYGKCEKGFKIIKCEKISGYKRPSKCKIKSKDKIREKKLNSITGLKKQLDDLWRDATHLRDNQTCVKCGKTNGKMDAHHIFSRSHFNTRWDLNNAILLCFDCHKKLAHENPLDFFDWLNKKAGEDWVDDLRRKSKINPNFSKEEKKEMIEELKKFIELEKIKRS